MRAQQHAFAQVQTDYFPLMGGLDQVTPPLMRKSGFCRDALNMECDIDGGYITPKGYERFDGQTAPSDASYAVLPATITGSWALGNTLTGATSTATGRIIAVDTTTGASFFVLTMISGTFVSGEVLRIGAANVGTSTDDPATLGGPSVSAAAQYKNLAADQYRANITTVPGSGSILGVQAYNDVVYAFRANSGGTAVDLYKSTAGGWSQVVFDKEISFTAGSGDVDEGDTLTQGGVTATIKRVVIQSGTLSGGTAAGRLIIGTPSGGNFIAGAATTTGAGALTLSGAQTSITLAVGGRFEFVIANFRGTTSTKRMYGCDGVNRAFEFDGTVFVPLVTGMSSDTPKFIAFHQKHLFLAFGASLQYSSIGNPYQWSALTGSAEIALGDTITGFVVLPGAQSNAALLVCSRDRYGVLYGTGSASFQLIQGPESVGAIPYTTQNLSSAIFLDDVGVTTMAATQNFGNFAGNAISDLVRTFINQNKIYAQSSVVVRDKSQYRLFFSNGYALYMTFSKGQLVGSMPQYHPNVVKCISAAEFSDGSQRIFFGSSDGYVYEMEKGTSFNGSAIESFFSPTFANQRSPRTEKHYRSISFEVSGEGYSEFSFTADIGYASTEIGVSPAQSIVASLAASQWDVGTWDVGYYDGQSLMPAEFAIEGDGENISPLVYISSDYFNPIKFTGAMIDYSPRRRKR